MKDFVKKLNTTAEDTNIYLKNFFSKKKKFNYLTSPMKYGVFSGGKRFRSSIIINTGKIYNINYLYIDKIYF